MPRSTKHRRVGLRSREQVKGGRDAISAIGIFLARIYGPVGSKGRERVQGRSGSKEDKWLKRRFAVRLFAGYFRFRDIRFTTSGRIALVRSGNRSFPDTTRWRFGATFKFSP